jgi:DUF1009 family protein
MKPAMANISMIERRLIRKSIKRRKTTGQKKLLRFFQALVIEGLCFINISRIISNLIIATPTPTKKVITAKDTAEIMNLSKFCSK